MIQRLGAKSVAVFALTALPVAVVTAFVASNLGSTAQSNSISPIAEAELVTTTLSAPSTAPTTEALVTTTLVDALEISDEALAVTNEGTDWERVSIDECNCSADFPGSVSQSNSALPDGRPAHLVLSQSSDSVISSALWSTVSSGESDRSAELATVLNAISGNARLQNQTISTDRVQADLIDGTTRAKIDVRSIGNKIVVLFIASSNGTGLEAASSRYFASFTI